MIGNFNSEADREINETIEKIAKELNASMAQIACAYVLSRPDVTAPIIGSTKLDSIKQLVDSLQFKLTEAQIKAIEKPYQRRNPIAI